VSQAQIAEVYARALFDAARDADAVEVVGRELGGFAAALAASASLRDVLEDPQVATAAKRRVLAEVTRGGHELVANVLQLLLERGRLPVLGEMCDAYDALAAHEAQRIDVEVTSAVELSPGARDRLVARVKESTGRRVVLDAKVDPSVVGGLVLRVGDVIIDGSVRARIRQLRRRLATAELRGDVE
jgi:F-type H+-transporting ATPase subunit delta